MRLLFSRALEGGGREVAALELSQVRAYAGAYPEAAPLDPAPFRSVALTPDDALARWVEGQYRPGYSGVELFGDLAGTPMERRCNRLWLLRSMLEFHVGEIVLDRVRRGGILRDTTYPGDHRP